MSSRASSGSSGVTENVVADVFEQILLLRDRHHHVLDGDDLADDVADLLPGGVGIELGELGQDERVEDRGLDVVILLGAGPLDGLALRLRRNLPGGTDIDGAAEGRASAARRACAEGVGER
jgi:hypothetical protein